MKAFHIFVLNLDWFRLACTDWQGLGGVCQLTCLAVCMLVLPSPEFILLVVAVISFFLIYLFIFYFRPNIE